MATLPAHLLINGDSDMRVFVTGATGFIGSAIVQELSSAGHQVSGLARSDASAQALAALGVEVHRGALDDIDSLKRAAAGTDGVIHTAFIHDFSDMPRAGKVDHEAILAMGATLAGSGRPLVIASGVMLIDAPLVTEDIKADRNVIATFRTLSEVAIADLAEQDVRAQIVRLPPTVHGDGDHGFIPMLIGTAREKRAAAYIGDGNNRWAAVHRLDAARLFRLALENGQPGARYHAIHDSGVPTREIAAVIGQRLGLPVVSKSGAEADAHFGWMGQFFGLDRPASSAWTREQLGWSPTHAGLLADLDRDAYFGG